MNQDRRKQNKAPINENISAKEVRLIGADGSQIGVVSLSKAQEYADEAKLDLVEIAPDAKPPVCRVMNYGKFLFEKKKQQAVARKNLKQIKLKEIKFRPTTEAHDYQVKLKNIISFLEDGDKVKISILFRGREMAHQQIGLTLLQKLEQELQEISTIEQQPKLEGRQLLMIVAPSKKKK